MAVGVGMGCLCRTGDASVPAVLPYPPYIEGCLPALGLPPVPHGLKGSVSYPCWGGWGCVWSETEAWPGQGAGQALWVTGLLRLPGVRA